MTRDALILDFQPRHSISTGDLLAVEAILRWPIRRLGSASGAGPPSGGDRALIRNLSGQVLQTACAEAMSWANSDVRISVKLIGPQLGSEDLCLQVGAALAETGLPPERLELAIPEQLVFGFDDDAAAAFAGLRDIGVNLLLDEFGHAVASLVALRDLPLTALKFDRLMLRGLPVEGEALALTRAVVETAHAIGLSVCADGVDIDSQRAMLAQLGLDEGQGTVFSPPLAAQDMRLYLLRQGR
ncbi:EAL domain-containing protein [Acidisoma cellulosilytica]|uniref:EAL domain-containing protein n=1 Tax=Acidisoma cellulosilyticum TaxID=2802395 RepID=A0A963Z180_9PROT|nr:EAL domain-containing protein [Acidisoma cellulosilyticum]